MDQVRLLDVVGELYEAALEPERWPRALLNLSQLAGGVGYTLFLWDKRTRRVPMMLHCGFSDQVVQDYRRYYSTIEPGAEFIGANPQLSCFTDLDWIDERAMDRNEFHVWLERESGVRYRLAGLVANTERYFGVTALQRTRRQGPPGPAEKQLFLKLLPHIRRATRISQEFSGFAAERGSWERLLETARGGVLLVDGRGRVVFTNAPAEAILAQRDGLVLDRDGHCRAALATECQHLSRLVGAVTAGENGSLDPGGAVAISRPSGRRPYALLAARLRGSALAESGSPTPVAAIFISDPEQMPELPEELLRHVFGLTGGEARLALTLLCTDSLKEAAALHITEGSARQVLKRIFLKTGCHSQSGLVRLLMSLPAMARPDSPGPAKEAAA